MRIEKLKEFAAEKGLRGFRILKYSHYRAKPEYHVSWFEKDNEKKFITNSLENAYGILNLIFPN